MPGDGLQFNDLLDPSFQQILCSVLISDEHFLARARGIIDPDYFNADVYRTVCMAAFEYWDEFGNKPPLEALRILVVKHAPSDDMRAEWAGTVERLYELPEDERRADFVAGELVEFAQRAQAVEAVSGAHSDLEHFDIEALHRRLEGVLKLRAMFEDLGLSLRRDWALSYRRDERRIFRTGFPDMDEAMRNGIREGELVCLLAPLKRGKSLFLINIGVRMMLLGYRVVHYTLEMQELDVLKRYIACLARVPVNFLDRYVTSVRQAIDMLSVVVTEPADVLVKFFPPRKVDVAGLEGHYNLLVHQPPYIPIIDYGDLLRGPNARSEEWVELSEIYMELRTFGIEYRVPVITASQTNVGGFNADELGAQFLSGSTRKGFHVDYMWGVNQTKTDYECNRYRLVPFLNRNERKDKAIHFKCELQNAKVIPITQEEWIERGEKAGSEEESKRGKKRKGLD